LQNDFYKYNTLNNVWSPITSFPGAARAGAFSFAIGDEGYIGMGYNYNQTSAPYDIFTDFYKYNSQNDTWLQLPDFPGGKLFAGVSFTMNNRGYVGLGSDTIHNTHYSDIFWEYDPALTSLHTTPGNLFQIFPTITKDYIYLDCNSCLSGDYRFEAFDLNGKLCLTEILNTSIPLQVNVTTLSNGIYLCTVKNKGVISGSNRFIKTE
jgi:hypothetical protein